MSSTIYLDVPGERSGQKRMAPPIPNQVSRSLSFEAPRSPRSPRSPRPPNDNGLSLPSEPRRPLSSAASCNRGPITSHPMIQRRPPPPYRRPPNMEFHTSNSWDSLEAARSHDISISSINSSDISTPDAELDLDDFVLRQPRPDIRKSRSDEEVIRKFRLSDELKTGTPPTDKKIRLKLDPTKFFAQKNPFHGTRSPRAKRRTAPLLDSPDESIEKRTSTSLDSRIFEITLNPSDEVRRPVLMGGKGAHKEQSFIHERQSPHLDTINFDDVMGDDPLNMTYPLEKNRQIPVAGKKRTGRIKSPSPIRRNMSKHDIMPMPMLKEGDLWFVISFPCDPEPGTYFEVQRIPQYDRYLSELIKETDEKHPDYDELEKTAKKVSDMVKERQEEMTHAENEYKVESVQDRFPNDDLELIEKHQRVRNIQSRRRSAPSAVLLKTLSSKNKSNQQSSNRPLPFLPDEIPTKPQPTHRIYLIESPVRMSEGEQTFERYMFLFNDLLLIAKKKSPTAFKLKYKIRLFEVWLSHSIDEVSSSGSCPADRSFVIGWPTTNYVATFDTTEMRDLWWAKLRSQISIEKRREEPKTIQIKILNRDMQAYASWKNIDVNSGQEANDVIQMCIEQFEIADSEVKDFQIWVSSGKDPPNSAYPLIGHEDVYSIKMNHVRDAIKFKGDCFILPCDTDFGSESVPRDFQVEFYLKRKGMGCPYLEDGKKKGSKKSPIITLFNRPKPARRESSGPGTSPGKFFGQRLADISSEDDPPKPIMELLRKLFHHGPFTQGIFRRSANARMVRELHEAIDTESDFTLDDVPILVIGDTIKSFFREMPGCIFGDDLYEKFLATNSMSDTERAEELKRLVENLPRCNQKLLRHLFCVLHHIHLKSGDNQMNAYNLAICIGPSLLKTPGKSEDAVPTSPVDTQRESSVIEFMVEHFEAVFGPEAVNLYGELRPRQDSSTDSDSLQSSHGRLDTNVELRREDSSSDSLNHDLDSSEMESSPRLGKSHLSPTNLSRDSGLTLSDSQLYDDDVDDARSDPRLTSQMIQRQKRRVSDPASAVAGGQIDTSRLYAKMAVPGNGMLTSNMGQQLHVDRCRSSPQHQVNLRPPQPSKRQQIDSLKCLKEGSVTDFGGNRLDDINYLKKSASGARIFFEEQYVSTQGAQSKDLSKEETIRSTSSVTKSQTALMASSSQPISPHTYRRIWLTETQDNKAVDQRSSSPNRQAIQARLSANVLDRRRRAGATQSAPVTPDQLSPAHRALSPSRSMAASPQPHYTPEPHLVASARHLFEQRERRRQQDSNQSSSDEERPLRDSRRKILPHTSVKSMVASLEKSNSDTNVLDRTETSPRHRPDNPPSYPEAIRRKNMLKQSEEQQQRDRYVTRCLSDHKPLQAHEPVAVIPNPAANIRRSHSEKDRTGRVDPRVKLQEEGEHASRGLERSYGKRGVFYIPNTRADETKSRLVPVKDNTNRYSTGAILDSVAPKDYDSRTSLSPPPRATVQRTHSDSSKRRTQPAESGTKRDNWSPTEPISYSAEEYFV